MCRFASSRETREEIPGPGVDGRRPKPTSLKLVNGNPGKRPLPKAEPKPKLGLPAMPAVVSFDPLAAAEWARLVELLTAPGARVLTVADGPALEATVLAYSTFHQARAVCSEKGYTYETESESGSVMVRKRPEAEIEADAWRRYVSGLDRFGLSPAMRAKVQTIPDQEDARGRGVKEMLGGGGA